MLKLHFATFVFAISFCLNALAMEQKESSYTGNAAFVLTRFHNAKNASDYVKKLTLAIDKAKKSPNRFSNISKESTCVIIQNRPAWATSANSNSYGIQATVQDFSDKKFTEQQIEPIRKFITEQGEEVLDYDSDLADVREVENIVLNQQSIFNKRGKWFAAGFAGLCVYNMYSYAGFPGLTTVSEKVFSLFRK